MDLAAGMGFGDIALGQFAAVIFVAFLGAIVGGVSAFGTGLLITPFIVPIFGIKAVVPIMAVAMTLGNFARAWASWRDIDMRLVVLIFVPALPGIILGTKIYDLLPTDLLSLIIGSFLLFSVPLRRFLAGRKVQPTRRAILPIAGGFGLVSGTVPGGGILILPILLGLGLQGGGIVGTDGLIGAGVNIVKIALFGQYDLLDLKLFVAGLLIGLCTIPGAFVARWIVDRLHVRMHTALVEVVVVLAGLSLIWDGLRQ